MSSASRAAAGSISVPGAEERFERHLIILMASRLALSIASLAIGLGLDAIGGNLTISEWDGFYATVAVAFVATLIYRPFVGRVRRPRLFASVNIATDIALVSALVLFSGGRDSVFTFFYVAVAIYAAMLFRPRAALACGALAGAAYGAVLLAGQLGLVETAGGPYNPVILLTTWIVHVGALVLVSALASFLVAELERTGAALDQRTSDLASLQSLHQRTVESLMSGLLTTDLDGRVTSFNEEAERIAATRRGEAIGRTMDQIIPGLTDLIENAEERAAGARARMPYRNREGEDLHLGIGSYVLRDVKGAPSGHVVIFQDVSEVVQMEHELRRSERLAAVGQLSASIAHEIRNPLAAISGAIQVMRDYIDDAAGESKPLMEIVEREVDRLNLLITDFLQFARPGRPHLECVPLCVAVEDVLEMFESTGPDRPRLQVDLEEGLAVLADAGQLRQLLWNLVLNAAQAMPEGGALGLATRSVAEPSAQGRISEGRLEGGENAVWAEIAVMDQGVGIPAEALDRVFDPFFTTKRGGSGLGLATVHRIVEDHGGSVRLESSSEDWSTVVRVRLPLADAIQ
jgi:two-component system sensor histidine kinase PilS (NtrC family)